MIKLLLTEQDKELIKKRLLEDADDYKYTPDQEVFIVAPILEQMSKQGEIELPIELVRHIGLLISDKSIKIKLDNAIKFKNSEEF